MFGLQGLGFGLPTEPALYGAFGTAEQKSNKIIQAKNVQEL
jgi:hypothetical protein